MATQEILVVYKAEVNQLTQQLEKIIAAQGSIIEGTEEVNKATKKGISTQELAAKKRADLIKLEEQEIKKLIQLRNLAYDPKLIEDYNKKIAASQANIKLLGKQTSSSLSGVASQIKSIGLSIATGFGAVLSVGAIVNFSKATVNAFLEAQQNAEKLKFAITAIGGESVAVFDRLIEQSTELQDITIFSDDSIQQAQAALSAFGLTGDEIERLIPKLADFATVTKRSIVDAAQIVGQGLQGMGREFKRYQIEVDASASRQQNLNNILDGFDQFAGAAENATKTLAGQLEQAKNQADELQENIGEKLAPAFVKARIAALEFAKEAVDFILNTDEAMRKLLKTLGLLPAEVAKTGDSFKSFSQIILEQVNAAQTLVEFDEIALKLRNDQTKAISEQQTVINNLEQAREKALSRQIVNLEEVNALNQAITKQRDTNLANEITKLNIIEEILIKQRAVKAGIREEDKKQSDVRVAGSAEEVKSIQALEASYADLFKLFGDLEKAKLIQLSITAAGDLEAEFLEKIDQIEELFKANEIEIPVKTDPFNSLSGLEERFNTLKATLEAEGIKVGISIDKVALENFRAEVIKAQQQAASEVKIPEKLELPPADTTEFQDGITATFAEIANEWLDKNEDIIASTEQLVSDIAGLFAALTERELIELQKQTDAQLTALDTEQAAIDEQLDKRRISETEAERRTEQLTKERIAVQKRADAEERRIKKRQFEIDKAAALVKIAINTAVAVTENLGVPVLAALIAVAGAAEAAAVAAQPNPYKKGTKSAKKGLALVDEEGTEAILRGNGRLTTLERGDKVLTAPKTKTYGEVLDAMMDGRFEKYVMQKYVAPQLEKQRKVAAEKRDNDFAENITKSMVINNMGDGESGFHLKKIRQGGLSVRLPKDQLDYIARQSKQDPYRS